LAFGLLDSYGRKTRAKFLWGKMIQKLQGAAMAVVLYHQSNNSIYTNGFQDRTRFTEQDIKMTTLSTVGEEGALMES
jgi:hypothetical protein